MKTKQTIFLTVFILVLTINTFSQIKEIGKKEYDAAQTAAESNFEKLSYRELTKIENFKSGKLVSTQTIVDENLPSKRSSWVSTKTTNDKVEKIEIIYIGYAQYRRENNGKWVKTGDENSASQSVGSAMTISGTESPNRKKYTLEITKLNDKNVNIYSVITVYDFEPNISHTFRRWINSDNLILQTEEINSEINSGKINTRTFSTYEYNPKGIKIEAPNY